MNPTRDLLLVHPPQRGLLDGFANGLVDLANFVSTGAPEAQVRIVDFALTPYEDLVHEACAAVASLGPDPVVGITTTTASYRASLAVARAFKAVVPNALVVLGGHHASPQHEVILRRHSDIVDVVVRGEGERALLSLVKGESPSEVPGCSSRNRGEVHINPEGALLSEEELDRLPISFGSHTFSSAPGKFAHATYVSARGCPLLCAFCAVAGQRVRAKSIRQVVLDLRTLVSEHGFSRIAIEDNFFAQNRGRVVRLCEALAALREELRIPFTWDCQTRVESMRSPDVQIAFAEAGCEAVYLGVESLVEEELLYLGKTSQPDRYIDSIFHVCEQLLEQPYSVYLNLQVALPGEDAGKQLRRLERVQAIGRLAARRGKTITVFPQLSVIYPGTRHYWAWLEQGAFGRHGQEVFESFCEWEAEEEPILRFLGEAFAHGVGGVPLGILDNIALRQRGEYRARDGSISELKDHLASLGRIDGVTVFKYGSHLAQPTRF